jgi:hypothetical protein
MFTPTSTLSEAYVEYTRLLRQLHAMIRRGEGDTEKADELRDAMDGPWSRLKEEELVRVRGLGADLNTIGTATDRDEDPERTRDFDDEFVSAQRASDWDRVLSVMRSCPTAFPEASSAYLRGVFWARVGDLETALVFLDEAVRLAPSNSKFTLDFLWLLCHLGRVDEVTTRILKMAKEENTPISKDAIDSAKRYILSRSALIEAQIELEKKKNELQMKLRAAQLKLRAAQLAVRQAKKAILQTVRQKRQGAILFQDDEMTFVGDWAIRTS